MAPSNSSGVLEEGTLVTGNVSQLGPPVVPFCPFLGEGSPTKMTTEKGTLILTFLLEDLARVLARRKTKQRRAEEKKTPTDAVHSAPQKLSGAAPKELGLRRALHAVLHPLVFVRYHRDLQSDHGA